MKKANILTIIIIISVVSSSAISFLALNSSKQQLTNDFTNQTEQSLLAKTIVQAKQLDSILGKTASVVEASAAFAQKIFSDVTIPDVSSYYHNPDVNNVPPDLIYDSDYGRQISLSYSAYKIAPTTFNLNDQATYLSMDPETWNPLDHVNSTVKDTILKSAKLDLVWRDLYNEFPGHVWLYMGFELGFHRSFPWHSYSKSYDPRIRPWYVSAVTGSKDVVVILDTSGSMEGTKFDNTKEAAKNVFGTLGPRDRLSVLTFSSSVSSYKNELTTYSNVLQSDVNNYVDSLSAGGGTDINDALLQGLDILKAQSVPDKKPVIIFMTDGIPTNGETSTNTIKDNVREKNTIGAKIFVFGLGGDVNQPFLQDIASQNNGEAVFIQDSSKISDAMSRYYQFFTSEPSTGLVWSYPYIDQSGFGIIITASKPVVVDGTFYGVISADLTLSSILDTLGQFKPSNSGYNFIFDSAGVMVAHPSIFDKEPKDWKTQDIRIPIEDFETEDSSFKALKDQAITGEPIAGTATYGLDQRIIAFAPIGNTSLRLASVVPEKDVAQSNYPSILGFELWQVSWLAFTAVGSGVAVLVISQSKKLLKEV